MEKDLICLRENHSLPLDMVCIDKTCAHKGLLCHKCFMTFPHHHLGSDIVSIQKFIDNCDKALDKAFESVASAGESQITAIREEYTTCNKYIEKCENYTLNLIKELFQKLKNTHEENYKETLGEYEGPKNNATRQIDKSRAVLRELKNGLVADSQEVILEINNLTKFVERNPDGQLVLNSILTARTDPKPKEKKLLMFKNEGKKLKQFLDKLNNWVEQIPVYDPDASKVEVSSPKMMRQSIYIETKSILNGNYQETSEKPAKKKEILVKTSSPKKKEELVRRSNEMDKYNHDTPIKKSKGLHLERHDTNSSSDSIDINIKPVKSKPSEFIPMLKEQPQVKPKTFHVARLFLDDSNFDSFKFLDAHAITFKSDKEIFLRGFGQWKVAKPIGLQAYFDYFIYEGNSVDEDPNGKPLKTVLNGSFKIECKKMNSNSKIEDIQFDNPVRIKQGCFYTLKLENKTKGVTFSCFRGIDGLEKMDPFTFSASKIYSDSVEVYTNPKKGQIPELFYNEIPK